MATYKALSPTIIAAMILSASSAMAQTFPRDDDNVAVLDRPRPELAAQGVRAGAFRLNPKITLSAIYDDNIYADSSNKVSDTIFTAEPSLELVSQWSRHQVKLQADSVVARYADHGSEDTTSYTLSGQGRLDATRDDYLTGGASYRKAYEARSTIGFTNTLAEPVQYDQTSAGFGGVVVGNRLRFIGDFKFDDFDYKNISATQRQDYRNRKEYRTSGQVNYGLSPSFSVLGHVVLNNRDYTHELVGVPSRSSSGSEVYVGADFRISRLIRGQIQVGYLEQDFDDPTIKDISSPALQADVKWLPSQLTTVSFAASRSVQDSGQVQASSYEMTKLGVQVDHELLRNLILSGAGDYTKADYRGADRKDEQNHFNLSATYLMSRNVGLKLAYDYLKQNSKGTSTSLGEDFKINTLSLALTLQY